MFRSLLLLVALLGITACTTDQPTTIAESRPMLDCPLRDAPFSIDSPLIDILLNPQARALTERATGVSFDAGPAPGFFGTTTPTFASILTIRAAAGMTGGDTSALPALDAQLRALPVTDADKAARCVRYDNDPVSFDLPASGTKILLFEKINGFRDVPSVYSAREALVAMAARKGWTLVVTDRAGAFTPETLARFDVVVWNNISGDVLTLSQRAAFQNWLANGGGYVGIHGSAGDPVWFWDWYVDTLIGARFAGHPMNPQFQEARVVADTSHPVAAGLPAEWRMTDEWYSFKTSPRTAGARVVLSLDESSYSRQGRFGEPLDMGADHPIAWTKCIGRGRMFYSAIGHMPETYSHPLNVRLLENGIGWAADRSTTCQ